MLAAVVPGWAPSGTAPALQSAMRLLFANGYAVPTVLILGAYFCNLILLHFLANWFPR